MARYRALTVADVRDAVAALAETRNRLLVRFRPEASGRAAGVHARSLEAAGVRRRTGRSSRRRCRRRSSTTGSRSSSSSATICRRWRSRFATRAGAIADPAGKAGHRRDDHADHRHGHEDAQGAGHRERARRSRRRRSTAASGRENSTVGFEVLKRNLGAGARHRRRRRRSTRRSRRRRSIARRSGSSTCSRSRRRTAARSRPRARHARLRRRSSVRPAGAGLHRGPSRR